MADADEAAGQDVEQKPAEEGGGIERGEPGGVTMGAVLPAEGDLAVSQRDEPIVGHGDAIGIATEVGQHLLRTGEGGLAIHDPRFACCLLEWATGIPIWSTNLLVVEGVLEQAQQTVGDIKPVLGHCPPAGQDRFVGRLGSRRRSTGCA